MAAPSLLQASTGVIITTGTTTVSMTGCTAGNLVLLHFIADGGSQTEAVGTYVNVTTITGTANSMLSLFDTTAVGPGAAVAYQTCKAGRVTANGTVSADVGVGASGEDIYARWYEMQNTAAGAAMADVFDPSTWDSNVQTGLSVTVDDFPVTTTAPDWLACNFIGINDDATGLAAFAGETGGDWQLATAIFESATGTDATLAFMVATMAAAGTITGGSDTITSDSWGVTGGSIKGTTAGYQPRYGYVNYQNPGVFSKAWQRRRSGIFVPDLWTPEGAVI